MTAAPLPINHRQLRRWQFGQPRGCISWVNPVEAQNATQCRSQQIAPLILKTIRGRG